MGEAGKCSPAAPLIHAVTICRYLCSLPLQAVGQAAAPSQPPHPARGGRRSRRRRPSYGAAGRRGRGRRATAVEAAVALALPAQPAGHGCRRVSQQVSSPCISDRPLKRIIHVALAIFLTSIRRLLLLLLLVNSHSRICSFHHLWLSTKALVSPGCTKGAHPIQIYWQNQRHLGLILVY